MAMYQNMLVVIDPNQDDQPALRRAVYLHQRIGGKIKAFLPIYDFSYEMTTLLSTGRTYRYASGRHQPAYSLDPRAGKNIISMLAFPLKLKWSGITVLSKPSFRK